MLRWAYSQRSLRPRGGAEGVQVCWPRELARHLTVTAVLATRTRAEPDRDGGPGRPRDLRDPPGVPQRGLFGGDRLLASTGGSCEATKPSPAPRWTCSATPACPVIRLHEGPEPWASPSRSVTSAGDECRIRGAAQLDPKAHVTGASDRATPQSRPSSGAPDGRQRGTRTPRGVSRSPAIHGGHPSGASAGHEPHAEPALTSGPLLPAGGVQEQALRSS